MPTRFKQGMTGRMLVTLAVGVSAVLAGCGGGENDAGVDSAHVLSDSEPEGRAFALGAASSALSTAPLAFTTLEGQVPILIV